MPPLVSKTHADGLGSTTGRLKKGEGDKGVDGQCIADTGVSLHVR